MAIPINDKQAETQKNFLLNRVHGKSININTDINIINMVYDILYDLECYKSAYYVDRFFEELDVSLCHPDIIGTLEGACSNLNMDQGVAEKFRTEAKLQYKDKNVSSDADDRRSKFKWVIRDGIPTEKEPLGNIIFETKDYSLYEVANKDLEGARALQAVLNS